MRLIVAGLFVLGFVSGCPSESTSTTDSGVDAQPLDGPLADSEAGIDAATAAEVEVIRDDRGIPHIFGTSLEAAFYGFGYATAQDRLFQMHFQRSVARGRLAELFAYKEEAPDLAAKQKFNKDLTDSDLTYRVLGYARHADAVWNKLPGDVPRLLQAFADGVNAWIKDGTFTLPPAFKALGLTSVEPWTPADSLLVWDRMAHIFGGPKMQTELDALLACEAGNCPAPPCDKPLDEAAAVVQQPADGKWPPASSMNAMFDPGPRPQGGEPHRPVEVKASHGWAVHGSCTTTGKPVLALDPKLPLVAPSYWYHFHLVAPGVDVRGITFAGAPGVAIYWNRHTSQTLTAGGGDIADLFELKPGAGTDSYVLDGVEQKLTAIDEQVKVRHGSPRQLKIRESHFGPVVNRLLDKVPTGRLFALRHAELIRTDSHSLVAAIELMRADSLKSYRNALRKWVGPTVNAIYAGVDNGKSDQGHIAYHALLQIPKRKKLTVSGLDFTGRHPYDGSTKQNDWSGIHDLNWNPHVIDPASCHLFSGNHLPVGKWHHTLLYSGIAGVGDTFRSLILRFKLQAALKQGKMTPSAIHALHLDASSKSVELYRTVLQQLLATGAIKKPASLAAAPASPQETAGRVLEVLDLWHADGALLTRVSPHVPVVGRLAGAMITQSRHGKSPLFSCKWHESEGGVSHFLKAFAGDPSTLTSVEQAWAVEVAVQAWTGAMGASPTLGVDPTKWPKGAPLAHEVDNHRNFFCAHPTSVPKNCSLEPAAQLTLQLERGYGHTINSAQSSSFPGTVDFADIDSSRALLPPGNNEDPTSPYYKDAQDEIEAIAAGVDKLPPAPLDKSKITQVSTVTLPYTPSP